MINNILKGTGFTRSILPLMSGTIIAQVIPVAISPILTRIYTPEEFGVLALYVAILSVVTVIANMRYEIAIVQPERDEDARALFHLSLLICFVLFIIFLVSVILYQTLGGDFLKLGDDTFILYVIPFGFFLNGVIQAGRYWFLRKDQYKDITGLVVSQSGGTASVQLAAGVVGNGLVIGQLFGQALSCVVLFLRSRRVNRDLYVLSPIKKLCCVAKEYKNMPRYSIPGGLADSLSMQQPIFFISHVFGSTTLGFFSLTFRVLNLPLIAISSALSQVVYKKVSDLALDEPQKIKPLLLKTNLILVALSAPFVLFFVFWGEGVFALVFGEPWREAGSIAGVLAIAVAIRFCVSPLSSVLALNKNVYLGMLWQFLYLFTLSGTLFLFYDSGFSQMLWAFVIHEVLIYSVYFFLIIKATERLKVG